jgi:DNA (cytosine-5)-methyltransferase 1
MIRPQFSLDLSAELIVDNFAGGGGASTGIELALGRHVDIAINHDPEAVAFHEANHPQTRHHCESVWDVDPVEATGGRPVGLAWFSPDCKHFSKAKGGKPREKKIRGLAWVAVKWAATVRPRVIMLENVEEFKEWGPLLKNGQPDARRKGRTFEHFVSVLRKFDYAVEWRELRACDYGAPTIRKRFFLIARCDGAPIVWPQPTHSAPDSPEVKARRRKAWRTAAECIDWTLACPSIFERKKPLAVATCRRVAKGVMRYVVNAAQPFIVPVRHSGDTRTHAMEKPLPTVTCAHGGELAFVAPHITKFRTGSTGSSLAEPVHTITAGPKENPAGNAHAMGLLSATLVGIDHQGSGDAATWQADKPLTTITAEARHALVSAFLAKHYGGVIGAPVDGPVHTITATDHHSLVTSHMIKMRGDADTHAPGHGTGEPLHTISAQGNHFAEVRAFLVKYYGTGDGAALSAPMHTVTAVDRFGLVTVGGHDYAIADLGLRMLAPRELYRAQGFPDSYIIGDNPAQGLCLPKHAQVRMCGNSVCPPLAAALVRANVPHLAAWSKEEARRRRVPAPV